MQRVRGGQRGHASAVFPAVATEEAQRYADEAMRWVQEETHVPSVSDVLDAEVIDEQPPLPVFVPHAQVLVVEDHADMRSYLRRLLSQHWEVQLAANGREALELAESKAPDLILADVMMPEMDGFGLLRQVRADERLKSIPFLLMTARAGEEAAIEGLLAGADDYLIKPFSSRELLARTSAQLELSRVRREGEKRVQAERQRMYDLFMNAPAAIMVTRGPQHVYELANPLALKIMGTHRPIIGKTVREVLPEAEEQGFLALLDSVYQTGQPFLGNEILGQFDNAGDGVLVPAYFNFVYQPSYNVAGEIDGILCYVNDVTETVLARKRMEESEKRQAFLLKLNDVLRALSDPVAILETATQTVMNYFDADRCYYCEIEDGNAIVRCDASRVNLPSVVGVYPLQSFAFFRAAVDAGHPIIVDDVHTTSIVDEELRSICIQLQVISFVDVPVIKNGKPAGILCLVQGTPRCWTDLEIALAIETADRTWEVVERAKAEEALQKSEKRLQLATDAAKMGTFIYYPQEDRGEPDRQMLALYGLPPDDTLNLAKALAELIHLSYNS